MVKEDRNAVPKHPCNGWIYFFQEQSKMTQKSSSNRMSMSEIREKWKALGDKASEEGRNKLILDLILCGENEIRNDVIRKAQEKYRNTRRM